jgi:hypothetical protein
MRGGQQKAARLSFPYTEAARIPARNAVAGDPYLKRMVCRLAASCHIRSAREQLLGTGPATSGISKLGREW